MKTFLKQATPEEREALAVKAGSSVGYFYLIAGGHRKAGTDLCKTLVECEPKLALHELRPDVWATPAPQKKNRAHDTPEQLRETAPVEMRVSLPKVMR